MSIKIALAGNPNCGKTTLFNNLTGSNLYVGNWPGVTVEKKEGKLKRHDDVIITDLPGIYSLSPYSPEEVCSRDYLVNDRPDVVINLVDSTNIERSLYLSAAYAVGSQSCLAHKGKHLGVGICLYGIMHAKLRMLSRLLAYRAERLSQQL